jgi:AraC-like DNA-binding protein
MIKSYETVNRNEDSVTFGISRMEEIYEKHQGKVDEPHRHNFYTVLLVKTAKGKHLIDFKEFELRANQVFFISPGQVHQVVEDEMSVGYSMVFSADFLVQNNIPLRFIEDLHLFNDYGNTPPLNIEIDKMASLTDLAEQMLSYYLGSDNYKYRAIGALLSLFLIQCNNLCDQPNNLQIVEAGNAILKEFKVLVDSHFTKWHATNKYADLLHITPDHLNRTVKNLMGKTAKEYIQSRIIVGAKRMLYFSDSSIKEIAFELGFQEPSNFNAFFKKCTGLSPGEFRNK